MKTIYGKVSCEYWSSPSAIQVDVDDDATEAEIMDALWEAAVEAASIEYWQTDKEGNALT